MNLIGSSQNDFTPLNISSTQVSTSTGGISKTVFTHRVAMSQRPGSEWPNWFILKTGIVP